jgi:hypothetical protein
LFAGCIETRLALSILFLDRSSSTTTTITISSNTMQGDDGNQEQADVLQLAQLVADLGSNQPEVRERATTLLHKTAKVTQQRVSMANTPGLIAGPLRVAGSSTSTDAAQRAAMDILVDMSWSTREEAVWQEELSLLQQLVGLASSQDPEVAAGALKALWYLAMETSISRQMAQLPDVITTLAGLVRDGNKGAPSAAVRLLRRMSLEPTAARAIAETPGAVEALVSMLRTSGTARQRLGAAEVLVRLMAQVPSFRQRLAQEPGLMERLREEAEGGGLLEGDMEHTQAALRLLKEELSRSMVRQQVRAAQKPQGV